MKKKYVMSALVTSVVAMAPAIAEEESQWENSLDFGLSLSKGNTDNLLLRFGLQTEKKDGPDAYFGSASYKYGEEESAATQDEIIGKATWKHAYSGKNFIGLRVDARRDTFADIGYRFTVNATSGYYWVNTETTVFSTELGLGIATEEKGFGDTTYLNGLFDQHFEHQFNENAKFYQDFAFSPRLDNLNDYRIEFEMGIETKITETIAFKVSFENRYESNPAEGKEKNDLKLITGLSYKF